jgi:hypothetical protein
MKKTPPLATTPIEIDDFNARVEDLLRRPGAVNYRDTVRKIQLFLEQRLGMPDASDEAAVVGRAWRDVLDEVNRAARV